MRSKCNKNINSVVHSYKRLLSASDLQFTLHLGKKSAKESLNVDTSVWSAYKSGESRLRIETEAVCLGENITPLNILSPQMDSREAD